MTERNEPLQMLLVSKVLSAISGSQGLLQLLVRGETSLVEVVIVREERMLAPVPPPLQLNSDRARRKGPLPHTHTVPHSSSKTLSPSVYAPSMGLPCKHPVPSAAPNRRFIVNTMCGFQARPKPLDKAGFYDVSQLNNF